MFTTISGYPSFVARDKQKLNIIDEKNKKQKQKQRQRQKQKQNKAKQCKNKTKTKVFVTEVCTILENRKGTRKQGGRLDVLGILTQT